MISIVFMLLGFFDAPQNGAFAPWQPNIMSKGNMFPFALRSARMPLVNQQLSERDIRSTCRELLAAQSTVSGRHVRRVLKERFNSVGKTERLFRIWREEAAAMSEPRRAAQEPADLVDLQQRLAQAEATAAHDRQRAERAELREEAHQDRWATEVDQLRQAVRAQPQYAAEIRKLQEQVLRLTVELHAARRVLAEQRSGDGDSR